MHRRLHLEWTLEELTAAEGALLKDKLAEAADACADDLAANFEGRAAPRKP